MSLKTLIALFMITIDNYSIVPVAMSLKRGCDESPSNKKGGWDICGTEAGAGAAAGAPKGNIQHEVILSQHDKAHPGNKEKIIMISG